MQPGETVLINGATGVTGQLAVQLARHYGAGRIVATGRNAEALRQLPALGATEVLSLAQPDEAVSGQLRELHAHTPFDVVIDYLWGKPTELIVKSLQGKNGAPTHPVRLVNAGNMAGSSLVLEAGLLRSTDITLLGAGLGSVSGRQMQQMFAEVLPDLLQLAAEGHLHIATTTAPLAEVEAAWHRDLPGSRLVLLM